VRGFTKTFPVEAEFFHAERQTDRRTYVTKLIVALRNFRERFEKAIPNIVSTVQ